MTKTKKYLRSTLLSHKGGVDLMSLRRDYREMVGEDVPFNELGFSSLEKLLQSLPDVCNVRGGLVTAVVNEATSHISKMVAKQNTGKGKKCHTELFQRTVL